MIDEAKTLRRLRELASLAAGAATPALREIHTDRLGRAVAAARRQGIDDEEIKAITTAAAWAARVRTSKIARSATIVGRAR